MQSRVFEGRIRCGMARILAGKNTFLKPKQAPLVHRNILDNVGRLALNARRIGRYPFVSGRRAQSACRDFTSFGSLFR
ncbi:hypothetical protein BN2476_730038 [Paraburkholderia piptadeniae]|uniref:Uncharacterized protein n=1 Tax=Paraburkholderia piptadeniae TaxID=1701573 RepID=A0A1N7SRK1_9BURK|nr:hypothetical protein BN2476_730038 [Paraburkholderia piptadeniae]